jgi:K+-transporting ATPase ATPase C chain
MKELKTSIIMISMMSLVLGIVYPLAMTGIAGLVFPEKAGGSLIKINGRTIGSELIGQSFTGAEYFHGRPSANNYDGLFSGGSNLGPANKKLFDNAANLADQIKKENGLPAGSKITADLVLASGSGLDPHISVESALIQVSRIAAKRIISEPALIKMIDRSAEKQYFNLFGNNIINVLKLNLALDAMNERK